MTQKAFDLDTAIDVVAKQLTQVEDDPQLTSRIVMALPERVTWFGWLMHSWAPRLAMLAAVIAAGIVWGNRRETNAPQAAPLASARPMAMPVAFVASVTEAKPNRAMPLERLARLEPFEPRPDFDRSLPSLGAVAVLEFDSLAPVSLPEDAPLTLAPLAIADLPLTAETISPR